MWRPEGWDRVKVAMSGLSDVDIGLIEAGADAMLEALKEKGIHLPEGTPWQQGKAGWLIFIPEEEAGG